ncbi:hypothetical protein ABZ923_11975 [Streptomyces sp. NPDC046881]|uniref:hypothetical protein n=1 Tax=Streptomyces sp. NPDC046881 TaxID=3155374 RepID=UPI0033CACA9C
MDATSGGVHNARIEVEPGYQVPFARAVRQGAALPVSAVGLITAPELARELLRNPTWPLRAAHVLRHDVPWPKRYQRGRPRHG